MENNSLTVQRGELYDTSPAADTCPWHAIPCQFGAKNVHGPRPRAATGTGSRRKHAKVAHRRETEVRSQSSGAGGGRRWWPAGGARVMLPAPSSRWGSRGGRNVFRLVDGTARRSRRRRPRTFSSWGPEGASSPPGPGAGEAGPTQGNGEVCSKARSVGPRVRCSWESPNRETLTRYHDGAAGQ